MPDAVIHTIVVVAGAVAGIVAAAIAHRELRRRGGPRDPTPKWVPLLGPAGVLIGVVVAVRSGAGWMLLADLAVVTFGIPLAAVDLAHRRLPRRLVRWMFGLTSAAMLAAATHGSAPGRLLQAAIALAVVSAGCLALALTGGLGGGDVRLAGALAAYLGWYGWPAVTTGLMCAVLLALAPAAAQLRPGQRREGATVPFGPFLIAGALLAVPW